MRSACWLWQCISFTRPRLDQADEVVLARGPRTSQCLEDGGLTEFVGDIAAEVLPHEKKSFHSLVQDARLMIAWPGQSDDQPWHMDNADIPADKYWTLTVPLMPTDAGEDEGKEGDVGYTQFKGESGADIPRDSGHEALLFHGHEMHRGVGNTHLSDARVFIYIALSPFDDANA